jgi:hypothetical protein
MTPRYPLSIAAFILLVCHFGCGSKPSIRVTISGDTAKIDVATLGEYPTTIAHVRLQNQQSHAVVWEIRTLSGTPQIHGFTLKKGDNPVSLADPDAGTYVVVYPLNSNVFRLDSGLNYTLELWKDPASRPEKVSIQFVK